MARNEPQVNLRMPQEMKNTLEQRAKGNNRSLTAEVIARLAQSLAQDTGEPAFAALRDPDPEVMAEIERRAKEWGCSKTQALIRITLEEVSAGKGAPKGR